LILRADRKLLFGAREERNSKAPGACFAKAFDLVAADDSIYAARAIIKSAQLRT
jgi:hypothetical protein